MNDGGMIGMNAGFSKRKVRIFNERDLGCSPEAGRICIAKTPKSYTEHVFKELFNQVSVAIHIYHILYSQNILTSEIFED